jgi:hypothetical protein
MNETPDEPRRPDEDRRGQQNDPAAVDPLGGQRPPPDEDRRGQQNDPAAVDPLGGQRPPPDEPDDDEDDQDEYRAPSRRGIWNGARLAAAGVAVVVLLGGGAALALTGGGGGDDGDTASSSDDGRSSEEDAAFEFAQCMRDNGIADFPDPQVDADGEGISMRPPDGVTPEEMEPAAAECEHILDDAVPEGEEKLTPEERAQLQDQWRGVAQCVRDQGYDMADPEVDEYGRLKIRAEGEGVEQAIEACGNDLGLGEPDGGDGESNSGGERD